MDLIALIYCV